VEYTWTYERPAVGSRPEYTIAVLAVWDEMKAETPASVTAVMSEPEPIAEPEMVMGMPPPRYSTVELRPVTGTPNSRQKP